MINQRQSTYPSREPVQTNRDTSKPPRIAIPDGNGGYTYEELEVLDLSRTRTAAGVLPSVEGTRRGIVPAPDRDALRQASPGELGYRLKDALTAAAPRRPAGRPAK